MLALGCSNDHNVLGNVVLRQYRAESGFDIYPKLFATGTAEQGGGGWGARAPPPKIFKTIEN